LSTGSSTGKGLSPAAAQPTLSHHLKKLRVDDDVRPDALDELSGWLR
jgi:hypothetical protein